MSQINFDLQASHSIISILEKSKLYSEALLKNLPDIFLLINHEGIVLKGNASVSTYFKVDSEMLLGQQLKKLLKVECWNIFLSKIDVLLKTETKNIDFELTLGTDAESEKVYYWSLSLIRKASAKTGPIIAVIGRDITELRRQERKLMEMFSCMPIGIVTIEKDCLIETPYSAYTEYLLGQSNLYGKDFFEILFKKCHQLSEMDKEGIKNLTKFYRLNFSTFEMMESTFPKKIKYPIETENKVEYRHFGLTYQPIVYENEVRRLMILIEDRTAIVNLEEENSKRRALEDTNIQRIVQLKTCDHEILPDVINELQQLVGLCQNLIQKGQMQELAHKLHGVKGNARIGDFRVLMNMAHALEKEVLSGQISEEDLAAQFAEIENEWKELMRMYLTLFFESIKLPTQVGIPFT
jgi:PAS domain S-box-containing protein